MVQPTQISKYAVLERLGTGGMAEVFRCQLAGIGGFEKTVVVKRILPHLVEDEAFIAMFLDEARIAANLNHPNVVQTYEIGQDDEGVPFIAMEYVRGATLSRVIRRARERDELGASVERLVFTVMGAALGLDYAHQARGPDGLPLNIVHRDVSPQNILVSMDGTTKIVDFGVAKADGRLSQTQGGMLKGKLRFMAPEALVPSDSAPVDRRADVFSLGVVLYGATTGRLPFSGETDAAVISAIIGGHYPKPSQVVGGYPPELEAVVVSALEGDLARRCPDCRTLAARLQGWLAKSASPVTQAEVAAWMSAAFPDADAPVASASRGTPISGIIQRTPSRASSVSLARRASQVVPPPPPAPAEDIAIDVEPTRAGAAERPRRLLPVAVAVTVLLVGAAVGLAVLSRRDDAPARPAAVPVAVTPPPAPAAAEPKDEVAPYLDAAGKELAAGRLPAAADLLARARARPNPTAAQDVALTQLEGRWRHAQAVAGAHAALDDQRYDEVTQAARALLDDDAADADALALLEQVKQRRPAPVKVAAARPGRSATLWVTASPAGAAVYVDDELLGESPVSAHPLAPGPHEVVVRKRDFAEKRLTVQAVAGRPLPLKVALEPIARPASPPQELAAAAAPPRLKVSANVPAQVLVDGVAQGAAPLEADALRPGKHAVVAKADGYESATQEVQLAAGEARALRFELKALPPAPAAAEAPAQPQPPRLPPTHQARTLQALSKVMALIENEVVSRGAVPPEQVLGATRPLYEALESSFSPGQPIEVYPRGMYWFLVRGAQAKKGVASVGSELKQAHFAGELVDLAR